MTPFRTNRHAGLPALLAILFLLAACATTTGQPEEPEVVERAKARWEALLGNDLQTAYTYLSPGYRSKMPYEDYVMSIRLRRVTWTSAEYQAHECEADKCTLHFKNGFRVNRPVPGLDVFNSEETVHEQWLKIDGKWWYLPKH